jgi:long-chain acyl-CoA synthetase
VRHVITTQVGDLFPAPKRWVVNLVVKHLKRMVPAWRLPAPWRSAPRSRTACPLPETAVSPDDIAFLQYTGGTTGRPKGAVLTHANMAANVRCRRSLARRRAEEGEETVVTALPLYHVFALTANLLVFMRLGGRNVLIANPRELGLRGELKRTRFTAITGVNTLYARCSTRPGSTRLAPTRALKLAVAGGMAVRAGGRALAEGHRRAAHRGLRPHRGLAQRVRQPGRRARVQRQARAAAAVDRGDHPQTSRAPSSRAARRARSACAARR